MSIIARAVEAAQARQAAGAAPAAPAAAASSEAEVIAAVDTAAPTPAPRKPLFAGPPAVPPAAADTAAGPLADGLDDAVPPNAIARLYEALADLDGAAMQACYADDALFADEVFTLRGARQIGGMWRMLCDATQDKGSEVWLVRTGAITDDGAVHRVRWQATYRFPATGRIVHNVIDATIELGPDGLIQRHRDRFSFWRWSRQALGAPGWLLGWSPWLRAKVRRQAAAKLADHLADPVHWTH